MKLPEKLKCFFRVPCLTRTRMILALAVAVAADGLQLLLGPLGWTFIDQNPSLPTPIRVLTVLGAAVAKANSCN